jgi:hypothetical protein
MIDKESVLRHWREHFDGLLNKEAVSAFESPLIQSTSVFKSQEVSEPTMEEVKKALQKLKNNKSPGVDTIPSELIKSAGDSLSKSIYELIRKIWMQVKLPDECKRSIICPIHKGDLLECAN